MLSSIVIPGARAALDPWNDELIVRVQHDGIGRKTFERTS
jgi:hypothetical protein